MYTASIIKKVSINTLIQIEIYLFDNGTSTKKDFEIACSIFLHTEVIILLKTINTYSNIKKYIYLKKTTL